ncbi:hypothetical protein GRI97_01085 [Altererythrobacter xixiisoli]|uniref:Carbohydrate kinase PfkB domain-containing protein n=1 Tax=Croceibacterium xixiisoli TaxID=1476466 RepID=A0A6I4TR37_9SPHN|nr:PfkB family carbohydrate kinase [Croceibacterium xixiisoli]MXO97581.1 hypothetical protein [Croceibacterium xixiisoli]
MTILVAGNAALLDLVGVADRLPALHGNAIPPAARADWARGGAALIAALRMVRYGHDVRLWHPVPRDDRATAMFADLADAGVDTRLCPSIDQVIPNGVILSGHAGRSTWSNRNAIAEIGDMDGLLDGISDVIIAPVWGDWADDLLRAASQRGIRCSLFGAAPPALARQQWYMRVGNAAQIAASADAGHPVTATITCMTRGAAGAVVTVAGRDSFIPAKAVTVIDATGADDAFAAIFMAAMIDGKTPVEAGKEAARAAAEASLHWGAWPVEQARRAVPPGAGQHDRVLGALAGAATGETLGMLNSFVWMPVWRKEMAPGTQGDDACSPQQGDTRDQVANSLNDFFMSMGGSDPLAAGPGTRRALQTREQGEAVDVIGKTGVADSVAMRLAPIGVFAGLAQLDIAETTTLVEAAGWPVHVTSLAISGASAVVWAIAVAIRGDAWGDVMQAALAGAAAGATRGIGGDAQGIGGRIAAARALAAASLSVQKLVDGLAGLPGADGDCGNVIPSAIAIADFVQGDPAHAIDIAGRLGSDADTIAALAAAVCGAYAGTTCLPADWRPLIDHQLDRHRDRNAPLTLAQWAHQLEDLARAHMSG